MAANVGGLVIGPNETEDCPEIFIMDNRPEILGRAPAAGSEQ
jgi:hypothetical protein